MRKLKISLTAILVLCCSFIVCLSAGCAKSSGGGYTIKFYGNGGTEYEDVTTSSSSQKIILPEPYRSAYTFEGWFTDETFSSDALEGGVTYTPSSDVSFYAKWKAIEFTVNFVSDGKTAYESVTVVGAYLELPVPEKDNYTFIGWFADEDLSGEALNGNYISDGKEVTLYAGWVKNDLYTITLVTDDENDTITLSDYGEGVSLPVPKRYGYEFCGWYENKSFDGESIPMEFFADKNVTFYAKWRETVYLYTYFGNTNTYDRISYEPNTLVQVEELEAPESIIVNGEACPFHHWANARGDLLNDFVIIGHTDVFAVYDESNAPVKDNFIAAPDGSYVSTHRAGVKMLIDNGKNLGAYSVDITFPKGAAGGVNALFRVKLSGQDYPYAEVGTEYLSAGFFPETGVMQIYRVKDGVLSNFISRIYLDSLPSAWREKFNSAIIGELVTMTFTVTDYGDGFDVYVDGDKIYSYSDGGILDGFVGTGFGIRSSTPSTKFSNAKYYSFRTITLEANGGINVPEKIEYAVGRLETGLPLKENAAFVGWFYDEQLTNEVDVDNPLIEGDATLYAAYVDADVNVTLYDGENKLASYGYVGGNQELFLPELENKANRIFIGWFYDKEATLRVNENDVLTESASIYAGYRLPKHDSFVYDAENDTYTISSGSANGAFVAGETPYVYSEYTLSYSVTKGVTSGSATLAFRMNMYQDNVVDGISMYLTFGLNTSTGRVGCGYSNGSGRFVSIKDVPLTDTPEWSAYFTGAQEGEVIDVTLCVRDFGNFVTYYINGEHAFTLDDAQTLGAFNGVGYGIRSSAKDITYRISVSEIAAMIYELTLVDGEDVAHIEYVDGNELPVPTTKIANRVFEAWYYDQAFTEVVDIENNEFSSKKILYAKRRLPQNKYFEKDGDAYVYVGKGKGGAFVADETVYDYTEYSISFSITYGVTAGAASLAFRMNMYQDNVVDSDSIYLTFGLNTASSNGKVQCGYSNGSNRWTNIYAVPLANTPLWKQTLDNATSGDELNVTLSVRDMGACVRYYVNGELAYTLDDAELLKTFDGKGYGIRSTASTDTSFVITAKEFNDFHTLTLVNGEEKSTITFVAGDALPVPESAVENRVFVGWCYDEQLTSHADVADENFADYDTLYAAWRLPTHVNMTAYEKDEKTFYECKGTVIAIVDETRYDLDKGEYTEYTGTFDFVKGTTKSVYFAFRMTGNTDNVTSGVGWRFLALGIQIQTGKYGFVYVNGGAATAIKGWTADNGAWKTYYDSVNSGETISCKFTIKDFGNKIECYFNDCLVYSYSGDYLTNENFRGIGYGIFATGNVVATYYDFNATKIEEE